MWHEPSRTAVRKPRATQRRRPLVLCIDDDPDITRAVEQILINYDVEVIHGIHGQQGIWDAVTRHPDLILTDLRMPHGDGEDLIACLKRNAQTAKIPIIVLSGRRGAHLPGRVKHLGADAFLRKPVHVMALLAEIGKFIQLQEFDWATLDRKGALVVK